MKEFALDARLEQDSLLLLRLSLCELRLSKDARWPWLILVPQRADVSEITDLKPLDQVMLTFEIETASAALKKVTNPTKINIGALGNIVRQLHVHIVARFEGDPGWPGPVWGHGVAEAYDAEKQEELMMRIREALSS
ncbi:HIT family protein [Oryzifoliimicrobium ureilyticus]|uniref:HIT family protein n=1 Tax=Oryzifoliimicrobium ureilyticus TaxID=3113724 RepID=UPI00307626B8